jgi:ketosteroid isomerase-like protein
MNPQEAVTQATLATIRAFIEATNRHDVQAVMDLMTAECVFENTYPPPDGQRFSGQKEVRGFWEAFFSGSPQARFETEELFAAGERAVYRWCYSWDDSGQGYIRGVDVFRVQDGKVAEKLSYVKG